MNKMQEATHSNKSLEFLKKKESFSASCWTLCFIDYATVTTLTQNHFNWRQILCFQSLRCVTLPIVN